jgi:hypothetical protein
MTKMPQANKQQQSSTENGNNNNLHNHHRQQHDIIGICPTAVHLFLS